MQQLETNLNFISSLPDDPTMTTQALKQEFDKAGNIIKNFINEILEAEITSDIASALATAKSYTDGSIGELSFSATNISYDNTTSGIASDTVQGAIDALKTTVTTGLSSVQSQITTMQNNPVLKTVDYDVTIVATQGYSASTTRTISLISGYTFIGFTAPYCQPSSSCSIKSVNGTTITIEGFNGGGGNPRVHFRALYIKN